MTITAGANSSPHAETLSWCRRAEEAIQTKCDDLAACGQVVREGILLRRCWDRMEPSAHERREILRLLPAVQNLCHQRLVECVDRDGLAESQLADSVLRQLDEDDQYLGRLLDDPALRPESSAFAVECFRDDLHWLGTQVAVLDGHRGVDFLGRILLEQEALQREIDAWEDRVPNQTAHARLQRMDPRNHAAIRDAAEEMEGAPASEPQEEAEHDIRAAIDELDAAAQRLRSAALGRQIEALLTQPAATDCRGWFAAWQTASRLAARLGPGPMALSSDADGRCLDEAIAPVARRRLSEFRQRAADQWQQEILAAAGPERLAALEEATEDLADAAGETLTFLEEMPLPDGVRILEILGEDLATNRDAVERSGKGSSGSSRETKNRQWTSLKRSLRRRERTVAGELQERRLAWRMERLFGRRAVAAFERLILALLVVFVVMLALEGPLLEYESQHWGTGPIHSGGSRIEPVFAWLDLGICIVFLAEFGLKMGLAQGRWLYLRRNWITGLVPAIPVGFLLYEMHQLANAVPLLLAEEGEWFVVLRFLRYLRLPRMVRWLRIARPALRMARLVVFMLRASDRLVRQFSPLLNRNLVLFERAAVDVQEPRYRTALTALRERFHYRAVEVLRSLNTGAQCHLVKTRIEDVTEMLSAPQVGQVAMADSSDTFAAREIPLESIVARLVTATPAGISDRVGRGLADSVARWCRAFDVFAVRRLPVIRDFVSASRLPSPYDTTARVANRIGLLLQQMLDRVWWLADLYGTVTAPQLVDSLGEWLIKGTARPARRFLMFGAAFLLVSYTASLLPVPTLHSLSRGLERLVGGPLVILGTLCLVPMLLGMWFRQIANEATDFYSQVTEAQFIGATRILKQRLARRNHAVLQRRVLAPELAMAGEDAEKSPGGACAGGEHVAVSSAVVELLWQDYLEGPPFHRTDVGTTNQLLGNLVLISLREARLAYRRRDRARLRQLDLAHARATFRGPYVWFHFISRSLAQHTAKLMVDYNAFALPLSRAETADEREIVRYVEWLARRLSQPPEELDLPQPFRARYEAIQGKRRRKETVARRSKCFQANDFTSVHFLSAEPEYEADIRRRYGNLVADLMRRDRRDNIRGVFRTYPFHRLPKEQRTVNPLGLYQRHMSGGRMLWLPLKIVWWGAVAVFLVVRQIWRFVREVLYPNVGDLSGLEEADPFPVAVRKIHRMRRPLFVECLKMRAQFDPEYLGVLLPGSPGRLRGSTAAPIEEDLDMIDAQPAMKEHFRRLAAERRRQVLQLRYWLSRFRMSAQSSQSLRAVALAYTIDYEGVRTRLAATRLLQQAFNDALAEKPRRWSLAGLPEWSLAAAWRRVRCRSRLFELFEQPEFSHFGEEQRSRCRRLVYCRRGELARALRDLTGRSGHADPVEHARRILASVAQDPSPWSRQLVVLRAVQTLSVLDLKTYCDLVYELGEYAGCGPHRAEEVQTSPDNVA
ncbi:MAG: hypothetical protein HUU20_00275 [Pirellulales bacterium]|nr:hypothetical protein [Pirellulales bacterium]